MSIFDLFRRAKKDDEAARRIELLRAGRIAEGTIFDVSTDEAGVITHIFFNYNISGVDYEASQSLDDAQRQQQANYVPGARITVRYNPRQPGNSVVV
ncbi:MAG TPA: DUF3592 domain-containing protein [Pyrinomonadaceae bacterium]|jgi:hypothetical protein|nr:DUF3592 domain-containing protein [Pyrinomonadaceae bacterium]